MSKLDISDVRNNITDYEVDTQSTDGPVDQKETTYDNSNWTQQLGYYKAIPELRAAIDAKARWTIGRGFKADPYTTSILDEIKGFGADTFNSIIENMIRTKMIGGDAFAEIILDDDGFLINLKPLDPGSMRIVANRKGIIIRYEQINKTEGKKNKTWKPEEIFHLTRNRVADEIHGVSVKDAVENIILMRNEAMTDWKRVLHRNVEPLFIFHLDTDNESKINAVKAKYNSARKEGENLFVPKGAVVPELVSVAGNATLNPLAWIEALNGYFYQAVGIPEIVLGNSKVLTEASAKIAFMCFQRNIEEDQLEDEEQILAQLNLVVRFEFPAIIQNEMLSEKPEVEPNQGMEPNDTTTEMEGRT